VSYYSDLRKNDIIHWIRPLLDQKVYRCRRSDGFFEMCEATEAVVSPWHHINYVVGRECYYLNSQLFGIISARTPAGQFVPRKCQQCWKIVIRPKTLKQLFVLEGLLLQLAWPSKCGTERRSYTPLSKYRYGGYIYSDSVDEGLTRLDIIRGHLKSHPELNDVECYLKRACTEMELAFPDSTTWTISDEQNRVEDLLDKMLIFNVPYSKSGKHMIDKVHMGWIEWAAEIGDETYLEYTDGERLYPECVRYERRVEGTNEATPDDETVSVGDSSTAVPKENTQKKTKGKKK
jgi:hypothetical protein